MSDPLNPVRDTIDMIRAIREKGGLIRLWGGALNLPQIIGGVAFATTAEGPVIGLTAVATLLIAGQIHRREPFSRLTGLCHLPWLILLPWLIWRIWTVAHPVPLTIWLAYVVVTIAISLCFDTADLLRYLRGQRRFDWAK